MSREQEAEATLPDYLHVLIYNKRNKNQSTQTGCRCRWGMCKSGISFIRRSRKELSLSRTRFSCQLVALMALHIHRGTYGMR